MQKKIYKVSTGNVAVSPLLKHLFIPFLFVLDRTLQSRRRKKKLVCPEPGASITVTSKCKVVFRVMFGSQFECNGTPEGVRS